MPSLPVTAVTAAVLGLIYIVLSMRVIMARAASKVSLGDGSSGAVASGDEHTVPLLVASRAHANFAEYVPLCLILIGLAEAVGATRSIAMALGVLLVIARVLHPIGMGRKAPNPYRAGGAVLTLFVLAAASLAILGKLLIGG